MPLEKRKVTMTSVSAQLDDQGEVQVSRHEATDYVPLDILDAYVADAQTRWQQVAVGDDHDPGPAGDDGDTTIPEHLDLDTGA